MINGQASLTNTILSCGAGQTNVSGTIHDGGHNISSDASAGFTAASSRNSTDPLLGPLSDHGGLTLTMALLPGSPALDAGDSAVSPLTDQRGVPRPQGLWVDIGAYELEAKLIVNDITPSAVQLQYLSPPGWTNQFWGSADFRNWLILGTKISGANGVSQFEDADWIHWTNRFYRVQVQRSR